MSDVLDDLSSFAFDDEGIPYYIYGDPAYPLHPHLLAPYKNPRRTVEEEEFNRSMSRVRVMIEWKFGTITQLWRGMDLVPTQQVLRTPVGTQYIVAVILTNMYSCLRQKTKCSIFFRNIPVPTLDEYFDHPDTPVDMDRVLYSEEEDVGVEFGVSDDEEECNNNSELNQ
jgi:hypothetical protein